MSKTRRKLLKWMMALPFAGLLATKFCDREVKRLYPLNRVYIAGLQYYQGVNIINKLKSGKNLDLVPEPENLYDRFAVKILFFNKQLGYVPRSDNKHISRLLRNGAEVKCRIIEVNPKRMTWEMVKVELALEV